MSCSFPVIGLIVEFKTIALLNLMFLCDCYLLGDVPRRIIPHASSATRRFSNQRLNGIAVSDFVLIYCSFVLLSDEGEASADVC